jgi:cysteine desulfurase
VAEAMLEWLGRTGDPGRVHTEGRIVRAAIEDARASVAGLVGVSPRSVVFTSGATEAINAAVFGVGGRAACAAVEHSAVRDASARLGNVTALDVDSDGRLSLASVTAAVDEGVSLVHCQWGNHEVGTLQPVASVVDLCRRAGILVHVDAAQACGRVPLDVQPDLMSISAHKFGGPPGVGALIVRRGLRIEPFIVGGAQERARRGGMENVAGIVGFGVAAAASLPSTSRDFCTALRSAALAVPGVVSYGSSSDCLPHIVCVGVSGVEAEAVLLGLDQAGIAAHSGSACSSETLEPSPVLEAMGVDAERSLRLSVGWSTTADDVSAFAAAFGPVVARLRALR